MAADLRSPGDEGRWHRSREGKQVGRGAVSTDVILIGSELSAFGSDTLEVLLSRSVGIADLKEKTLFTNRLTMKLSNDLLADFACLESVTEVSRDPVLYNLKQTSLPSKANTTAVVVSIPEDSAGTDGVVHEDSTKFLPSVSLGKIGRCVRTYRFSHILGKVRDVEIGRLLIALGLETRVERLLKHVSDRNIFSLG